MTANQSLLSKIDIRLARSSASLLLLTLAIIVYLGSIAFTPDLLAIEDESLVFDDPYSLTNIAILFIYILSVTAAIIAVVKYNLLDRLGSYKSAFLTIVRGLILAFVMMTLSALFFLILPEPVWLLSPLLGIGITLAWSFTGHWAWLNVTASIFSIYAIMAIGTEIAVFPILLFFALMTVYDFIAVYVTKHMVTLAEAFVDSDLPVPALFVIPIDDSQESISTDGGTSGLVLGAGDIIFPGIIIVSASVYGPGSSVLGIATIPALGALAGSVIGFLVLFFAFSEEAHAGLPVRAKSDLVAHAFSL